MKTNAFMCSVMIGLYVSNIVPTSVSDDTHFKGRNIALRQLAVQSGDYAHYVASKAVDGNTNRSLDHGSCAHTADTVSGAWWGVFFDKPYTISGIIIYHRDDHEHRFKDFEVTGYGQHNTTYTLYNDSTLQQFNISIILIKNDRYSREKFIFLKISVPTRWESMLQLCEVEVYTDGVTDNVTEEVLDRNTTTVESSLLIVGLVSGVGAAFITTIIILVIWRVKHIQSLKYRRTLMNETTYTDMQNAYVNVQQPYDEVTSDRMPDGQMYEDMV